MNLRSISWQQAVVLVACVAGTFAAYKFLGPEAAGASMVVSMVLNFMLGRAPDAPPGPELQLLEGGAAKVVELTAAKPAPAAPAVPKDGSQ